MSVLMDLIHSLKWMLHYPVIILRKDEDVDAVETAIVVKDEKDNSIFMMK